MRNQSFAIIAMAIAMVACSNEQANESTTPAEPQTTAPAQSELGEDDFATVLRERPVDCELTVDGETYIDGICHESSMATGSAGFIISGDDYFAYLSIDKDGSGQASWNGSPDAPHADKPLGEMRRDGDCWVGDRARICARTLPPEQEEAIIAKQASGITLYPASPGWDAGCIRAVGKVSEGANLMIDQCGPMKNRIFARAQDGTLSINGHPELCLDLEGPGMMKPPIPVLVECDADASKWTHMGKDGAPGVIRTDGGLCMTIPETGDSERSYPTNIVMRPCDDPQYEPIEFNFK